MPLGGVMLDVMGEALKLEDVERLQHPAVGGVILFSKNYTSRRQLIELIEQIHSIRRPRLLIAVDQEGGRVQRFKEGFTALPPMSQFGRMLDQYGASQSTAVDKIIRATGQIMAEELIDCGVDFSFAPVLDLGVHQQSVIGDRAFHSDPTQLVQIAEAYIEGMNRAGMTATGKHFPGHGYVDADSHTELPIDPRPIREIENCDLKVFAALKDRVGAMMTAHVRYPDVDIEIPTYSPMWLQNILRKQLKFKGLIVSDDLTMQGAAGELSVGQRCRKARQAGCDLLLICNDTQAMDEGLSEVDPGLNEMATQGLEAMRSRKGQPKVKQKVSEEVKAQLDAFA